MDDILTHYTNLKDFKSIINSKTFWPRYNPEEITHEMKTWYSDPKTIYQPLNVPMVCFCDADVNTAEHIKTYNGYGIGFSKKWALKNGLCPVMYIHRSSVITDILHELFIENAVKYRKAKDDGKKDVLKNHNGLFWISLFTKPYEGYFMKTKKREIFYLEREWRFIPKLEKNQVEYSNNTIVLNHRNNEVKNSSLNFSYNDIIKIHVLKSSYCEIEKFLRESKLTELIKKIITI